MIIDVAKKDFVKNCLREFLLKNSTSAHGMFGFAPCDYKTFSVNAKSIETLTDYLFSEMESQKSFFDYRCDGLLDDENKILKLPYRNSEDIRVVLEGLINHMFEYRAAHHRNEDTDLRKLIDCVEETYQKVVHIEAVEREQKRKEEEEKKEYTEYLRLKKKYEN